MPPPTGLVLDRTISPSRHFYPLINSLFTRAAPIPEQLHMASLGISPIYQNLSVQWLSNYPPELAAPQGSSGSSGRP